jgi:hypothetical protein
MAIQNIGIADPGHWLIDHINQNQDMSSKTRDYPVSFYCEAYLGLCRKIWMPHTRAPLSPVFCGEI